MSSDSPEQAPPSGTLAKSMLFMLGMTLTQRVLGLLRGVAFCRFLSPTELGLWDVAQGFLIFAAPFVTLGIPGTFTRFLAVVEQQGRVHRFLLQAAAVVLALAGTACAVLLMFSSLAATYIYGTSEHAHTVQLLGCTLGLVIAFNFGTEALAGLRLYRRVSWVQFVNALGFAVFSCLLLYVTTSAKAIILGYGLACLVSLGMIAWWLGTSALQRGDHKAIRQAAPLPQEGSSRELWQRVLKMGAWIWLANCLTNLYDLVDRYALVHLTHSANAAALADVGQYHTSRMIPMLVVNLATLLAQSLLAHLSHQWETGKQRQFRHDYFLGIKVATLALTGLCAAALVVSPWLFGVAFGGKFSLGQSQFPMTLTYSLWAGLTLVVATRLWCAERAGLMGLSTFIGLLVNAGLACALVPTHGLPGAVAATFLANLVVLALTMYWANDERLHFPLKLAGWMVAIPFSITQGWPCALVVMAFALAAPWAGVRLFNRRESRQMRRWLLAQLRPLLPTLQESAHLVALPEQAMGTSTAR